MPDLVVHVPTDAVQDLAAAVARQVGVPVPPTNPEKLAMVTQYTQRYLQQTTASYRSQNAGALAHDDTMDENWAAAQASPQPASKEQGDG